MAAKRRLRFSSVAGPSPKRGRAARGDDDDEEERPPQEPDESEEEAPSGQKLPARHVSQAVSLMPL